MTPFDVFKQTIESYSELPHKIIEDAWNTGEPMIIPPKTAVGHKRLLHNKLFFINDGYIREYALISPKEDITFRFFQGPSFMTVSLFSKMLGTNTPMKRATITEVNGMAWDLDTILKLAKSFPGIYALFCTSISQILQSLIEQDIRNAQLSSRERYEVFLEQFPNIVNHVPLKHISSYLNMRPETISRVRAELKNK